MQPIEAITGSTELRRQRPSIGRIDGEYETEATIDVRPQ